MESDNTAETFKEKINAKDSLKYFLMEKNRNRELPSHPGSDLKQLKFLLKPTPTTKLNVECGHSFVKDIGAG